MYSARTSLHNQIAAKLGGMTEDDLANLDLFQNRVVRLANFASERNTYLYVDAEQTFIQAAIESFGQQMTHVLNVGEKVVIMNGYQAYLKRVQSVLPMEVKAAKALGYNLGIKMVRGAYMNEERALAEKTGIQSPVFDDIEGTHQCFNDSMKHIISQMKPSDKLFLASHNQDTVTIA